MSAPNYRLRPLILRTTVMEIGPGRVSHTEFRGPEFVLREPLILEHCSVTIDDEYSVNGKPV